ncbi:MAG: hypothetical protein AB1489_38335, partial [Acidobacteriota bacterium]
SGSKQSFLWQISQRSGNDSPLTRNSTMFFTPYSVLTSHLLALKFKNRASCYNSVNCFTNQKEQLLIN